MSITRRIKFDLELKKKKKSNKPNKKKENTIIDENEQLSNIRAKRTPNEGMVVHNNKETATRGSERTVRRRRRMIYRKINVAELSGNGGPGFK